MIRVLLGLQHRVTNLTSELDHATPEFLELAARVLG